MIKIVDTLRTAAVSTFFGIILGIGVLWDTSAPEWVINALITITTLQVFIYISSSSSSKETADVE